MDKRITGKVGGSAERGPFGEQLWAAHWIKLIAKNLVRRAVRSRTGIANCQIGFVGIEFHYPVHPNDRQRDVCVFLAPSTEPRDQPPARERAGGRYAQRLCLRFAGE
jgi:hypothetical protein